MLLISEAVKQLEPEYTPYKGERFLPGLKAGVSLLRI
jgi:hypothetical protein